MKGLQREISMLTHEKEILARGLKGVKGVALTEEGEKGVDLTGEGEEEFEFEDGLDEDYVEGGEVAGEALAKRKKKTQKELTNEVRKQTPMTKPKAGSRSNSSVRSGRSTSMMTDTDDEDLSATPTCPLEKKLMSFMDDAPPVVKTEKEIEREEEEKDLLMESKRWELQRDRDDHEAKQKEREAALLAAEAARKASDSTAAQALAMTNLLSIMYAKMNEK